MAEVHKKVWGKEVWIANNPLYCGKILFLKKGFRCSMHAHKIKTETFHILSGKIIMALGDGSRRTMVPGDTIDIAPGTLHSFEGIENSKIMEISTQHFENDSYRVDESGPIGGE